MLWMHHRKAINIVLSPDASNPYATLSDATESDLVPSSRPDRRHAGNPEAPQTKRDKKTAGRHVRSQGNKTQRQAMIHPIFRQSPESDRAGAGRSDRKAWGYNVVLRETASPTQNI